MSFGRYKGRDLLVLGGGGARGSFEWGALRILFAAGMRPDEVWGVSVGSLVGYYAACHDLKSLGEIFDSVKDPKQILKKKFLWILRDAKYSMEPLMKNYIRKHGRLEDLKVPYHPVYVDLDAESDNKKAPLAQDMESNEELWIAMQGSSAIPGIMSMPRWNGHILSDGGVMDVVPLDFAAQEAQRGDRIWVVACRKPNQNGKWERKKNPGLLSIIERVESLGVGERIENDVDPMTVQELRKRGVTVHVIWPNESQGGVLDFYQEHIQNWRRHGEEITLKMMQRWYPKKSVEPCDVESFEPI